MLTSGNSWLYAACHAPKSGNRSVLPVSVIVFPDDGAADVDEPGEDPELLQATASTVSGTRAAAVQAKRIRLVTGEYSFSCACLRMRQTTRTRLRAMGTALPRCLTPAREGWLPPGRVVCGLAEMPADIVSRFLFGWVLEDLSRITVLDEPASVQEDGPVSHPAGLRQVVRDDQDGAGGGQVRDQ